MFAQDRDGSWHLQGHEHAKVHEYRDEIPHTKFHRDGTFLAKIDTLRIGLFKSGEPGSI